MEVSLDYNELWKFWDRTAQGWHKSTYHRSLTRKWLKEQGYIEYHELLTAYSITESGKEWFASNPNIQHHQAKEDERKAKLKAIQDKRLLELAVVHGPKVVGCFAVSDAANKLFGDEFVRLFVDMTGRTPNIYAYHLKVDPEIELFVTVRQETFGNGPEWFVNVEEQGLLRDDALRLAHTLQKAVEICDYLNANNFFGVP